jgi:hypothetical protein
LRRRAAGSKQDVCDRKPNPLISIKLVIEEKVALMINNCKNGVIWGFEPEQSCYDPKAKALLKELLINYNR